MFIEENVCSGLSVSPDHRQNLHGLILGAQGVSLATAHQQFVSRIEEHNKALRIKADAITAPERRGMSVDTFCALQARSDIDSSIQTAERALAATQEQEPVRNTPLFDELTLPTFDVDTINALLQRDLPDLDTTAGSRVQEHLISIGRGGETWVADGMRRVPTTLQLDNPELCPFCAQDLRGSPILSHYRAYFSTAYADLKSAIAESLASVTRLHGNDVPAAFERAVRVWSERRQFWSQFCEIPEVSLDTAETATVWREAREGVTTALQAKQSAPLDRMSLSAAAVAAIVAFGSHRQQIADLNERLQEANSAIRIVKEQAAAGNQAALTSDLARLKAVKARHMPETVAQCDDYLREVAAKGATEKQRDQARDALDQHRRTVFPAYQTAINMYLQRFNAEFRLDSVVSTNTRGGLSCTYDVVINSTNIPVTGGTDTPGNPSFRNILSAGDRSTLALALFFASLDQAQALAGKIVVIDDPITSLDEHRSLTTAQEMRRLAQRVQQVILLSHSKPFLCRIWENADANRRTALHVARDGTGSTIRLWDVNEDCITEHDRRHTLLREYIANSTPNNRDVARSIRPVLEAFLRVAYPEHFLPGTLLGPFRNLCEQRVGTPQQILDQDNIWALHDLTEYANRFHHDDTNPSWQTAAINDTELRGFVLRTLEFAR